MQVKIWLSGIMVPGFGFEIGEPGFASLLPACGLFSLYILQVLVPLGTNELSPAL
jgi:hypothetical protein